ncbi:MAG: thioredoxin [Eubacteriales bacterium]|nr:thioredoxin [Eubacteriales bacterium]
MSVLVINKENFKEKVLQSEKPVLLDLWATWCGPCKMLSPVVEELAEDHPEITVGKINVDEEPELAQAFQVSSIPMLVLVQDGKVKNVSVGYKRKNQIEQLF